MRRKYKIGLVLSIVVLALSPILLWLGVYLDDRPVQGLRIEGVVISMDEPLDKTLKEHAQVWADTLVAIKTGPSMVKCMRRDLGGRLEVAPMVKRAMKLGRSGNPITDLRNYRAARNGLLKLSWLPEIDREQLGRFVEQERNRSEVPPTVGISDGEGWSIAGTDGETLDYADAVSILRRALRGNKLEVRLPLRPVKAPEPILIGSPDGMLFELEPTIQPGRVGPQTRETLPPIYANLQWLLSKGNDCHEKPPFRPFCDGPRMVPKPYGLAMTRAIHLELGGISAVRQLLGSGPTEPWIRAGGGPVFSGPILWPVPNGLFGRGFGYVRKRLELRDHLHKGVDVSAPMGSHIIAVNDGIVVYSDNRIRGYGNLLIIVHSNGAASLSAHCSRIFVFAGQRVSTGQVVAEIGSTGMSMGPHLHFEYHIKGRPINPMPLFSQIPKR